MYDILIDNLDHTVWAPLCKYSSSLKGWSRTLPYYFFSSLTIFLHIISLSFDFLVFRNKVLLLFLHPENFQVKPNLLSASFTCIKFVSWAISRISIIVIWNKTLQHYSTINFCWRHLYYLMTYGAFIWIGKGSFPHRYSPLSKCMVW